MGGVDRGEGELHVRIHVHVGAVRPACKGKRVQYSGNLPHTAQQEELWLNDLTH